MKIKYPLAILTFIFLQVTLLQAQSYKIDVQIENVKDSSLILGYYFNKKIFVKDTTYVAPDGTYSFSGEEPLKEGLYIVYLEDKSYFDVMIGKDQSFQINTNKSDLLSKMTIKGSSESADFLAYQQFLVARQKEATELQQKMKAEKDKARQEQLKEKLNGLGKAVNKKYESTVNAHPNSFLALFLNATQEVEVPQMKAPAGATKPDSIIQRMRYNYYKEHYFDNFRMDDERTLRTPFFTNKLDNYFDKVLLQLPDTIIKESHRIIAMANGQKEMEKYLIQHLFNRANESKIMGMDAVMVAIGETYYLSGHADWVDQEFLTKLEERVTKLKPNLLGNHAPDFKMQSYTGEFFRLSEIDAEITILMFWEPECGHCEKEVPKLNEDVWNKYKEHSLKIVAVYTQWEKEPWEEFIHNHALEEWIHLYDPYNKSNFRNNYDIYSTPVVYILDKDKKILAKRLGVEQIPGFLDHHFKLTANK